MFREHEKNSKKFKGDATVEVRTEKTRGVLPILITKNRNTQQLLGLDWLDKLEIGLQSNKNTYIIRNINVDKRSEKILNDFEDSFKNNCTIEGLTIDIQLKKDIHRYNRREDRYPSIFRTEFDAN